MNAPGMTLVIAAVLNLLGCASSGPLQPFAADAAQRWPAPPQLARVHYVRSFSSPGELGLRPGVWDRFIGLLVGSERSRIMRPMGLAVTPDAGLVAVADPGAGCVHRFDLAHARYDCLPGPDRSRLPSPIGVAVEPDGTLYTTDSALAQVFTAAPNAREFRRLELSPPVAQPTGIALAGGEGLLYVTDTENHVVRVYDASGSLVREIGGRGGEAGRFNYPTYVWSGDGEILVSDSLNFRIQRFDAAGGSTGMFGRPGDGSGDMQRPKGLAADVHGHIYVADALSGALQIFDRSGRLLLSIGGKGQAPGQFWLPAGVAVTSGGLIFVADSFNHRVQVFRHAEAIP